MYFYHEHCHDAYRTEDAAEDGRFNNLHDESYEPIRVPAVLNWLAIVGVALCVIVAAIQGLS